MDNGTITIISSRPMGPMDYYAMGRDAAMQEIECLYRDALNRPQRKTGAKGKGDVTPSKDTKAKAAEVKSMGRGRDTELAHIRPDEAKLLKDNGGRGSRNPKTGLLEFDGDGGGDGGGDSGGGDGGDAGGSSDSGGQAGGYGSFGEGGGYSGEGTDTSSGATGDAAGASIGGGESSVGGNYGSFGEGGSYSGEGIGTTSYGDFGEGGSYSGEGALGVSSGPTAAGNISDDQRGGDALTGGVGGNSPASVAAAGGGQPGAGFGGPGGPTSGNAGVSIGSGATTLSSEGDPISGEPSGPPVVGEAADRSHANFGTRFGASVAQTLESVLSNIGLGYAFNTTANPFGMVGGLFGHVGGPLGQAAGALGLGNAAANIGNPDGGFGVTSGAGRGGEPSGPTGQSAGNTSTDGAEDSGVSGDIASASGPTGSTSGGQENLDSAVQRIMARPGSRSIAGTPYAPSFGGADSINPAALSAALGQIGRPRPGPGLNFGRTTYL